jgi:hypothetical protein
MISSKHLVHDFTSSAPFLSKLGSLTVVLTPLYLFFISNLLLFIYFFMLMTLLLLETTCLFLRVSFVNFILSFLLKIWALLTTFLDLRPYLLLINFFSTSSNICVISWVELRCLTTNLLLHLWLYLSISLPIILYFLTPPCTYLLLMLFNISLSRDQIFLMLLTLSSNFYMLPLLTIFKLSNAFFDMLKVFFILTSVFNTLPHLQLSLSTLMWTGLVVLILVAQLLGILFFLVII